MKVQCDHLYKDSYVEIMHQMASDLKKWQRWSRLWQCLCEPYFITNLYKIVLGKRITVSDLESVDAECRIRYNIYKVFFEPQILYFELYIF